MDHNAFFDLIKTGALPPCCLLEGPEEYVKRSAVETLKKKLLPAGLEEMNLTVLRDPDAETLIAAAETQPFLADRRLVLVQRSALIESLQKAGSYDEGTAAQRLIEYLPHAPESCCIVFVAGEKADGRKKLTAWLKKQPGYVMFATLSDNELNRWIAQSCKRLEKKITVSAAQKLVFSAGRDLTQLHNEIEKLAAYAGDRDEITDDDVEAVAIRTTAYRVYDLTGALTRGDSARAFALAAALQKDGEEPLYLLALLQAECRRMLSAKLLRGAGLSPDAIAGKIGMPPFAARQLCQSAAKYTEEQLKSMCAQCMDTEYSVKSGRLPLTGALEKAMLLLLNVRGEKTV